MKRIIALISFLTLLPVFTMFADSAMPEKYLGTRTVSNLGKLEFSSVHQDKNGLVWISTRNNGIFAYDGSTYVNFLPDQTNSNSLLSENTYDILVDSKGTIWVATQKGVDRLLDNNIGFKHYFSSGENNFIQGLLTDKDNNLYYWTSRDIFKYNENIDTFSKVSSFGPFLGKVTCIVDSQGKIWSNTGDGMECFNPSTGVITGIPLSRKPSLLENDGDGYIYVFTNKLEVFDERTMSRVPVHESLKEIQALSIRQIVKTGTDYLLFLTDDELYSYDIRHRILLPSSSSDFPFMLSNNSKDIKSISSDEAGQLWFLLNGGGAVKVDMVDTSNPYSSLFRHVGNRQMQALGYNKDFLFMILDDSTFIMYDLHNNSIVKEGLSINTLGIRNFLYWRIFAYNDGSVIIENSSESNLYKVVGNDIKKVAHFSVEGNNFPMPVVVKSESGSFWAAGIGSDVYYLNHEDVISGGSEYRLKKILTVNDNPNITVGEIMPLEGEKIIFCFSEFGPVIVDGSDNSFDLLEDFRKYGQIHFSSIVQDLDGKIWIGSTDCGLFSLDVNSNKLSEYPKFENLPIRGLFAYKDKVYVNGDSAIYSYDKSSGQFNAIWSDNAEVPLMKNIFILPNGSFSIEESGTLQYVHIDEKSGSGPGNIVSPINVILSSGKDVQQMFVISGTQSSSRCIQMSKVPSNFNLSLSLLGYSQMHYEIEYRINSKGGDWHSSYTSSLPLYGLKSGKNVLEFRIKDMTNSSVTESYSIVFKISRPFYFWLILVVSLVAVLSILFTGIILYFKRKEKLQAEKEKTYLEEINKHNIDFFANISHEFRTPLTLIDGAVDCLTDDPGNSEQGHMKRVIRRNTDRMLKLISQMLDFNKLDHDMLKLHVCMSDASSSIRRIVEQFEFGASQKDIDLTVSGVDSSILMYLDEDKLEKILYNLLSNALKYTAPGGKIDVSVSQDSSSGEDGKYLRIDVKDTGSGIPQDKLAFIFERFARVDSVNKSAGTGIGLYFAQSLAKLHHGNITADNRTDLPEGKTGSVFTVTLSMDPKSYTDEEKEDVVDNIVSIDHSSNQSEFIKSEISTSADERPKVLVIDDDYEMAYFLKSILSVHYAVATRFDAMSGYNIIEKEHPDIIISDVMMVDVDGLQLCRMVKENAQFCHIPVILLTAKTTMEDQIKGLGAGADAYVAKPFNKDYLLALVKSQLDNRQRIRQMFSFETNTKKIENDKISSLDKALMTKLYELMETNLEEGELNIESISAQLGFSRTSFFSKIKTLTGQTPNDFFNTYKLNRAAELIIEGKYKISAIAEIVGFGSPSYFSSLFKKHFGVLPSQYYEIHCIKDSKSDN